MKKNQVTIGNVYTAKVSGKLARVRITRENPHHGGWDGLNLDTHRKVRIKTAGRLQRQIADPDAPDPDSKTEPVVADTQPAPKEQKTAAEYAPEDAPETEPVEAQKPGEAAPDATQAADTPPDEPAADQEAEAASEATSGDEAPQETRLTKMTVSELSEIYQTEIQRDTSSTAKNYLVWKIRQARKGKIPIGPRTRRATGEAGDFKVLPLRMEAELVKQLDEARERLGFSSRMDLLRRSIHAFLLEAGEVRVAEMFAPAPTSEA